MTGVPPDPAAEMDFGSLGGADQRFGFAAVIGAPNAGKSTLVNQLVGAKVAIVTPKVQTTRTRVLGLFVEAESQVALVDTPGIFAPRRRLDRAMVASAWTGADDADMILLVVDAKAGRVEPQVQAIIDRLADRPRPGTPVWLVLNKIDLCRRDGLLGLAESFNAACEVQATYMISATTGDGVGKLRADLAQAVSPGAWMFPEDQLSDMPLRLLAAEITREKAFLNLYRELPYALTVETETWTEREDGSVEIRQVIIVERESQRAIVLGRGGKMIKTIGTASRQELESELDHRVHLELFVKVRKDWSEDPERYAALNLDYGN